MFYVFIYGYFGYYALHRNVSILTPIIIVLTAIGSADLFNFFFKKKNLFKISFYIYFSAFLIFTFFSFSYSFANNFKSDSRVKAMEWLIKNVDRKEVIGTNEFCSGLSPADFNFITKNDKSFSKKYDYYLINLYWKSLVTENYTPKRPIILILDQSIIHYYYFNEKNLFTKKKNL